MMTDDKRYRECVAEIVSILEKYDMAGAVTVVDKERAMFRYVFPTWSCMHIAGNELHFKSLRKDYPSGQAQRQAAELSAHIVAQIRDIAAQTFTIYNNMYKELDEKFGIEHEPFVDFDPEREQ